MAQLTPKMEEWLRNPPPGSKAAAARDAGVDLELLIENLKLTPTERALKLRRNMEIQHKRSLKNKNYPDAE